MSHYNMIPGLDSFTNICVNMDNKCVSVIDLSLLYCDCLDIQCCSVRLYK